MGVLGTQKQRDEGAFRALVLQSVERLMAERDLGFYAAAAAVAAEEEGATAKSIENWYYGANGNRGARMYAPQDRAAALIPGYAGRAKRSRIPQEAWDWFVSHFLSRSRPTVAEVYRRTREAAEANNWGELPSLYTFRRRVTTDILIQTRILEREGPEALAKTHPPQRRDKRAFRAGQAVSGDGLKFDHLWVRWPDGEVINTSTGWFWAGLRTNYICACRLAKTETSDLFRLATYDLTRLCVPKVAYVDNTMVAASKKMTAGAGRRNRGRDLPDDPPGLLAHIGIEVRFTNPDKVVGSPGAKPVERSFGIGGIHEKVATHPDLQDRGYSKAKAVPYAEFASVVAQEVLRFNQQTKRRTAAGGGVLSYEQAFHKDFEDPSNAVRKLTDEQCALLLLTPEKVHADRRSGEISIRIAAGPMGEHRYWNEALADYKGRTLQAFYDPQDLTADVTVFSLDGRRVCEAQHLGNVAFADHDAAKEHGKNRRRYVKAAKKMAEAERRMKKLEVAAKYPKAAEAEPPEPGVVTANFEQSVKVVNGSAVDGRGDEAQEYDSRFTDRILEVSERWLEERRAAEGWGDA